VLVLVQDRLLGVGVAVAECRDKMDFGELKYVSSSKDGD
jgi:hypothetical protein